MTLESVFKEKLEKAILLSFNAYLSNKARLERFAQWAKMINWDSSDDYFFQYENPTHREFQSRMPFCIELHYVDFDRNDNLREIYGAISFDITDENREMRYELRSAFTMSPAKVEVLTLEDYETQYDIHFEDSDTKLLDNFHCALEKEILLNALKP